MVLEFQNLLTEKEIKKCYWFLECHVLTKVCDCGVVGLTLGFRCQGHEFESRIASNHGHLKKWVLCFNKVTTLLSKKRQITIVKFKNNKGVLV